MGYGVFRSSETTRHTRPMLRRRRASEGAVFPLMQAVAVVAVHLCNEVPDQGRV
jgi:hypothetical protein